MADALSPVNLYLSPATKRGSISAAENPDQTESIYREASKALLSNLSQKENQAADNHGAPDICGPFQAVALDVAACKQSLGVRAVLDNLSATGFDLRLSHKLEVGEKLLVITQVAQAVLMLRGEVVRLEQREVGVYDAAVSITQHQIFSSLAEAPQFEKKIHR